jgi:hypothetical protein
VRQARASKDRLACDVPPRVAGGGPVNPLCRSAATGGCGVGRASPWPGATRVDESECGEDRGPASCARSADLFRTNRPGQHLVAQILVELCQFPDTRAVGDETAFPALGQKRWIALDPALRKIPADPAFEEGMHRFRNFVRHRGLPRAGVSRWHPIG